MEEEDFAGFLLVSRLGKLWENADVDGYGRTRMQCDLCLVEQ